MLSLAFESDEDTDDATAHHVISARQLFQDLSSEPISTVGHILSLLLQPSSNLVAKFLTWHRNMRMNHVSSAGQRWVPNRNSSPAICIEA